MSICWFNGTIQSTQETSVSVLDHGFLYGDGVFEGLRFYNHKVFALEEHIMRLFDSAKAICLEIPYNPQQLSDAVLAVVAEFDQANGYIRLIITRGKGALGIDPRSCAKPNCIIITQELQMISDQARNAGAKLIIASTRRLSPAGLDPRIKSLNYLNHIMAKMEANAVGADEAILLNEHGHVCEGSADNIFIVKNNQLYTPPTTDGALAGITRQLILRLAEQVNIQCHQQSLASYDLFTADECFLTGTGAELIPVAEISGRAYQQSRPVFQRLNQAFQEHVRSAGN